MCDKIRGTFETISYTDKSSLMLHRTYVGVFVLNIY